MGVGVSGQNQGTGATVVVTGLNLTAGSTLIAGSIRDSGSTFTSIAYSGGGSMTQIGTELVDATAVSATRLYYQQNIAGGAGGSVTLTKTNGAFATVLVVELVNMLTSGVLDQQNRVLDTASPFDSPSITTTQPNEVLVAFSAADDFGTNVYVAGNSFTIQQQFSNGGTNWTCALATRIVTSTGSYNSTFTRTGAARAHSWIASFIEAAAAAQRVPMIDARHLDIYI
jgi:hypothetical protein